LATVVKHMRSCTILPPQAHISLPNPPFSHAFTVATRATDLQLHLLSKKVLRSNF
jgi:hypothetical protein